MSDEKKGVIVPAEGSTSPNEMRGNMLNLASIAQLLSINALMRGDKKTAVAYACIGMSAIFYFRMLA